MKVKSMSSETSFFYPAQWCLFPFRVACDIYPMDARRLIRCVIGTIFRDVGSWFTVFGGD